MNDIDKLIFIDTETTGLPVSWHIPPSRYEHWPNIVEVAWIITDYYGNEIENQRYIIKPEGWVIPTAASRLHKITTKKAEKEGENILVVLDLLEKKIKESNVIIAHNIEFDLQVIEAEYHRYKLNPAFILKKDVFCTMKQFTDYCAIVNRKSYNYKYPKLSELHEKVMGTTLINAHTALSDVYATMFCFFKLKEQKVFELESPKEKKLRLEKENLAKEQIKFRETKSYILHYNEELLSTLKECADFSEAEIVQKRNTLRSNITNRRNTIKKYQNQISEVSIEDEKKLFNKINKKNAELNNLLVQLDVLNDIILKGKNELLLIKKTDKNKKPNNDNVYFIIFLILIIVFILYVVKYG